MAITVFGGDADISQHSSLISEGSAIAQIEKELQEVVTGVKNSKEQERERELRLASFNTPPLHFDPSNLSSDSEEGDITDSAAPQSSPAYVPTAVEQRSAANANSPHSRELNNSDNVYSHILLLLCGRSSVVPSQASNHSSLRRRLGESLHNNIQIVQ